MEYITPSYAIAACFPMLNVDKKGELTEKDNCIEFCMSSGDNYAFWGKIKVENALERAYRCVAVNSDPQDDIDVDHWCLSFDEKDMATVIESDSDSIKVGTEFVLTYQQIAQLQEVLDEYNEYKFEQMIAA